MSQNYNEARMRLAHAEADLDVSTQILGDIISTAEGYHDADGMDAIIVFLVNRHHWLPRDVRAMSREDIRLVLADQFEAHKVELARRLKSIRPSS